MELTKKALEDVKFRTRGRWYNAEEVDAFLEELTVAVDGAERELQESRQENRRLWRELDVLKEAPAPEPDSVEARRRICQELERERDELIQDIKALRRFRETFRESVAQDAASLSERVKGLGSDKLL